MAIMIVLVLVEQQTYRLMGQNREHRSWPKLNKYSQLIFDKGTKQSSGERIVFSTNGAETTGQLMKEKKKKKHPDTVLIPSTKINSKWIIELSVKHRTLKLLEVPWLPASQHVNPSSSQSASSQFCFLLWPFAP